MNNFDWSQYRGNLEWLPARTIYMTRHGSHAYGTSLPTSDLDLRGVAIAPARYQLGYLDTFEQAVSSDPDLTVFSLQKFFKLASDCNPNVLEILYTDESDHLLRTTAGDRLLAVRDAFLSQKVKHTFSGYAAAQLKRIKLHRRWLMSGITHQPTRAEFGLPERTVIPADQLAAAEAGIRKKLDEWEWHELEGVDVATRIAIKDEFSRRLTEITGWQWDEAGEKTRTSAARALGYDDNFIRLLDIERQYTGKLREWQQYTEWKRTRNEKRAELEAKFGYDTKHGMHLVRLLRMCREILETGRVVVRRPDAEELLAIRAGAMPYDALVEWAEREDAALTEVAKSSKLPKSPDRKRLDALCVEMTAEAMGT